MQIKPIINMEFGQNAYLVYKEPNGDAFIIDPGGYADKIKALIEKENLNLKYIILTHGHGDHIFNVQPLMEEYPDAVLTADFDEKETLKNPELNLSRGIGMSGISLNPGKFVSDGEKLEVSGIELVFLHTPGHTPGGMCIVADKNCIFTGDTLFAGSIGRTDLPGGDYNVMMNSLERLKRLDHDMKVYPGHGPETTIGKEIKYNPFLI